MREMWKVILILVLTVSCGKGGRIEAVRTGPDSFLVWDRFCTTEVQVSSRSVSRRMGGRRVAGARRKLIIKEDAIRCSALNVTKEEYIGEVFSFEEAFEDGERIYIIGERENEATFEYLIRNNLIEEE